MKKKLSHTNTVDPPCAKKDKYGKLITVEEAFKKLYVNRYKP